MIIYVGEQKIENPEMRIEKPDLDALGYKKGSKGRKSVTSWASKQIYVYIKIAGQEITVPCRDVNDLDGIRIPKSILA